MLVSHHSKAVVAVTTGTLAPQMRTKVQHMAKPFRPLLEATKLPKFLYSWSTVIANLRDRPRFLWSLIASYRVECLILKTATTIGSSLSLVTSSIRILISVYIWEALCSLWAKLSVIGRWNLLNCPFVASVWAELRKDWTRSRLILALHPEPVVIEILIARLSPSVLIDITSLIFTSEINLKAVFKFIWHYSSGVLWNFDHTLSILLLIDVKILECHVLQIYDIKMFGCGALAWGFLATLTNSVELLDLQFLLIFLLLLYCL